MKAAATLKKPSLNTDAEAALKFASKGATQAVKSGSARGKPRAETRSAPEAGNRVFFAPEGDKRLTINLRQDLHKKLKMLAVEQETTVGDLIEALIEKHL